MKHSLSQIDLILLTIEEGGLIAAQISARTEMQPTNLYPRLTVMRKNGLVTKNKPMVGPAVFEPTSLGRERIRKCKDLEPNIHKLVAEYKSKEKQKREGSKEQKEVSAESNESVSATKLSNNTKDITLKLACLNTLVSDLPLGRRGMLPEIIKDYETVLHGFTK